MAVKIHPTAVIDSDTEIDHDVEIGPYVVIGPKTSIGKGTIIGPHNVIEFSTIGKNNIFTAGAYIGTKPQEYLYDHEYTQLIIGDNNVIREGVTIHRGGLKTYKTIVGDNCMIMAYSHVAHDCRIGNNVSIVNFAGLSGHVEVDNHAIISGHSAIHQFVRIGKYSLVSGGSMVTKDIPPFCIAQGDRAKLRGINVVGLKRKSFCTNVIQDITKTYKKLFLRKGILFRDAIINLENEMITFESKEIISFCKKSDRGIAAAYKPVNTYE